MAELEASLWPSRRLSDSATPWWKEPSLQLSRSLYDSAFSWPSTRYCRDLVKDLPTSHRHCGIRDLAAAEEKPFRVDIIMAKSKAAPRLNRTLYDSASSWPSTRHCRDGVEGFLTPHRYGRIGDFDAAE